MTKAPIRVYADTSVFGGVFDDEFAVASDQFFVQARRGRFQLIISPVLEEELLGAPERVLNFYREVTEEAESAGKPNEAVQLQEAYMRAGIVAPRWADDALHVAFATVNRCSMLVSWNFKRALR